MIKKVFSKLTRSSFLPMRAFSGDAHHDGHHAAPENEKIALFGFNDVNDHHHADHTDPYAHLENTAFFSFKRMYFADPYYTPDELEPLMNEPHGYLTNDDPLDVRNNFERPVLEYSMYFLFMAVAGLMLGYQGIALINPEEKVTADMLEEEILKIRKENSQLEALRDELKAKLNE